jgi:ribonucleoside-diphosphate reductase alpha chain
LIGINPAKRVTTIKPAGTTSLVLGCSSGIHAYHAPYYIRRMRIDKNESLYTYLSIYHPDLLEDDYFKPKVTAIIKVPQKSPLTAVLRNESATSLLERVKDYYDKWIVPGHISGANTHNISVTVSIKEDEWDIVGEWMWVNQNHYNGISVLPYDGGSYKQPPFEDCTKEVYDEMLTHLTKVDLSKVVEIDDTTNLTGELACSGGNCEIK